MKPINIAITAACFSGNKGAAAMLQSSIKQLRERYGEKLNIFLMSTYPGADRKLIAEMPEKYDFIKVVNAKPERLLFLAFPLSILYSFLRFIPPFRKLLQMDKIIKAYSQCDIVIDEAGISFVDRILTRSYAQQSPCFAEFPSLSTPRRLVRSRTAGISSLQSGYFRR